MKSVTAKVKRVSKVMRTEERNFASIMNVISMENVLIAHVRLNQMR